MIAHLLVSTMTCFLFHRFAKHSMPYLLASVPIGVSPLWADPFGCAVPQANKEFAAPGQSVILVDETIFPFTFDSIRRFLTEVRAMLAATGPAESPTAEPS